jgi:hypothetical protein
VAGELTHAEIQRLLGAYALDAVDGEEAEIVELHVRDCPRCRAEVNDHREVAALMAHTGRPAPAELWSRIASSLEVSPEHGSPALELSRFTARRSRRTVSLRVAAALSAAAALIVGVLGVKVLQDGNRIDALARPRPSQQLLAAANAALVDGAARRLTLRSADRRLSADVVMLPDGTGYLVKANLPAVGDDEVYQLWALIGTSKISAGVLGRHPSLAAFKVDANLSGLAITRERAPGSSGGPGGDPVAVGEVRPQSS